MAPAPRDWLHVSVEACSPAFAHFNRTLHGTMKGKETVMPPGPFWAQVRSLRAIRRPVSYLGVAHNCSPLSLSHSVRCIIAVMKSSWL